MQRKWAAHNSVGLPLQSWGTAAVWFAFSCLFYCTHWQQQAADWSLSSKGRTKVEVTEVAQLRMRWPWLKHDSFNTKAYWSFYFMNLAWSLKAWSISCVSQTFSHIAMWPKPLACKIFPITQKFPTFLMLRPINIVPQSPKCCRPLIQLLMFW